MVDVRNGGGEASSFKAVNVLNAGPAHDQDHAQSNAPSPTTATADDMPPSKASSKASSTRTSTPAAVALDLRPFAQATNGAPSSIEQPLQSQPMTATTSNSSHTSAKEPKDAAAAAAPYGTRSRNRAGARPNYAEDVEMDFEMSQAATHGNVSGPLSRNSIAAENGQSAGVGGKKGSGAVQGNAPPWGNAGPNPKDNPPNANIPGTSTFDANPITVPAQPAPPPKRRKNAAGHATNGSQANAAVPSQVGARRANNATPATNYARESNMMTFAKSGAFLRNGCLEADDGQVLSVNGRYPFPFIRYLSKLSRFLSRLAISVFVSNQMFRSSIPRVRAARRALLPMQDYGIHPCRWQSKLPHRLDESELVLPAARCAAL